MNEENKKYRRTSAASLSLFNPRELIIAQDEVAHSFSFQLSEETLALVRCEDLLAPHAPATGEAVGIYA